MSRLIVGMGLFLDSSIGLCTLLFGTWSTAAAMLLMVLTSLVSTLGLHMLATMIEAQKLPEILNNIQDDA